jgi:hypothetical protein
MDKKPATDRNGVAWRPSRPILVTRALTKRSRGAPINTSAIGGGEPASSSTRPTPATSPRKAHAGDGSSAKYLHSESRSYSGNGSNVRRDTSRVYRCSNTVLACGRMGALTIPVSG